MSCGRIGLCVDSSVSNSGSCTCSSGFRNDPNLKGCTPASFTLADGGCDAMNNGGNNASSNLNSSEISYVKLDNGIDYFANKFVSPIAVGMSSTLACETLCTNNCSCLGFFYANSSGSCYLIKNQIGSVTTSSANGNDRVGYIKAIGGATNGSGNDGDDDDQGSNNFPIAALVLLPSAGFFLLVLLLVLVFIKRRRSVITKKKSIKLGRPNSNSSSDLDAFSIPGLPVRFDFDELEGATENFGSQIGSGGFGSVYKGTLADKSVVAVKKINNLGNQGKKEFCTEIAIIGKIHHVNLVRLRGFCAEGSQRLLVYEYMNRGSLDRTLFGAGPAIEWQERVDIALGTARGLAYLHSGCENKIIHCDIKPENILLHDHFHVKISDFGLSKLLSPEQSSHFTTMRGTRGYLAPEWLTSSAISDKTDVYSYGMVLLELVSGRKNCSMRTQSHSTDGETTTMSSSSSIPVYFPLLALDMHEQGRYVELADPRLEGRVTNEAVEKLVRIALCCVHEDPNLRPTMVNVVSMLEGTIPLGKPRGESLNFLRFYGRRFNESSVLGGSNGDNRFMGFSQVIINASHTSTTSGSGASYSYISSQQISGPR
ncbi:hypothetical protein Scep_002831 [Stephania cephalantha]|uniref:Protein kinase domain-containing protein n=1 Tax=Stephania cephalantha TaxID=152367 RepID=A0AAP0LDG7_9MAGN